MDRALLILCALLLNVAIGGPHRFYAALGLTRLGRLAPHVIRVLERKLNRAHRSLREREIRGTLLAAMVISLSVLLGMALQALPSPHGVALVLLALLLPVRPAWDRASGIAKRLQAGNVVAARQLLEGTGWRHHMVLDEYGVTRAAIELLAVHFSEKILAPALWYLLLGLPGLLLSRSVFMMKETIAHRAHIDQGFGKTVQGLHLLLHYVPARIAALFWIVAAVFLPTAKMSEVATAVSKVFFIASPNIVSLTCAASVLKLSLGGPASVYGDDVWIGDGPARPTTGDLKRALTFFLLLQLFLFVFIGAFL